MKLFGAALGLLLCCPLSGAAQDKGAWRAETSDAKAITGDIAISASKLSINFRNFTIAEIRSLTPTETAALFEADSSSNSGGSLYRLSIPAATRFQHHNTLCGTEDTQWMATYASGPELQVAFFSGPKMPVFSFDALNNSSSHCGTFTYTRY